ncbi:L-threonylcarbamoyladenylate synthase, partial [Salsipaludibacter albus]|uniref:L-threonylcarbamoyladenylate synthase n=1 Tax=Salsipaludibacter albus TaxID=2849650 RepID=UPI001EE49ACE
MSDETPTTEVVDATADLDDAVAAASSALRAGELAVLPTDTVYGVAADAFNPGATMKVFDAKRRQRRFPLPVLIRSPKQLMGLVPEVSDAAENLMAAYWPGPLTIVVRTDPNLAWDLGRNEDTVAVRMPMDDVTLAVIRSVGPLAVTSANLSGQPAATTARLARGQLGDKVRVYVDAGRRADSQPSTIVDLTRREPKILRSGPLDDDQVLRVARGELAPHLATSPGQAVDKPVSPGGPAETTPSDRSASADDATADDATADDATADDAPTTT